MKYISLFSGIEAATVAWGELGWEPLAFCEIEDFPSAVLSYHYPNVPNLGDICKVDWKDVIERHGRPDVIVGGSPCFTAGTLVLCESGFKPIEEVNVGDRVVTHKGRLRSVLNTGHQQSQVGDLKVHGMIQIHCTPTHPILTSKRTKADKDENGYWYRFGDESFVGAEQSVGMCACSVRDVSCEIPKFPDVYGMRRDDVMELIGWYLGDGSIAGKGRANPTLRTLVLTISPKKFVRFVSTFKQKMNYRVKSIDETRCSVFIHNTDLCRFIERWFGRGAENKNLPAWVYALPEEERIRLFNGYASTDGTTNDDGRIDIESVSKRLIVAMQMLLGSGSACAIKPRETRTIKGVEYRVKPIFKVSYKDGHSRCWSHNGYSKRLIESFGNLREETVYNLEVEDDNSYTADGIAVHNCQSFSVAGGRESLDGESRLMFEYIRALAEIRPKWFLWENVPGVLNTRDNAFVQLLREVQDIGYLSLAWRVLDAQFFGVAQRRRRVFLVGHLGTGGGAAAVLFESESVRGNTQTSKQKREELARAAGRGTKAGGGESLNGWDVQSKRVFPENGVSPTLSSGTGEGANIQPSVLQSQSIDYKQTPKVNDEISHTLTRGGDGGIHSAVLQSAGFKYHQGAQAGNIGYEDEQSPTLTADYHQPAVALQIGHTAGNGSGFNSDDVSYTLSLANDHAVAFAQNTRDEVRLQGGDGQVTGPIATSDSAKGQGVPFICMADDTQNAAIDENLSGTLKVGGGYSASGVLTSSGEDVVGALCAADGTKGVGSQYVSQGKVICQRVT